MRAVVPTCHPALRAAVSPLALLIGLGVAGPALSGPQGGNVTRGSAVVGSAGPVTTVDQASQRAVIEWQSFDVGVDETVRFNQPDAASVTLNRVRSAAPSDIAGAIEANGNVWVLNRNGVMIRDTARIDVGGFVASSLDIADDAFMAGSNRLTIPGEPDAQIVNEGTITFGAAGLVGLVGPHAENRGTITGTLGNVVVGGRAGLAVDLAGDGLIAFEVAPEALAGVETATAGNSGTIAAAGSRVTVTAAEASALVDAAVSMEGVIAADTLGTTRGAVEISGGDVAVSGTVSTRGAGAGEDGGTVAVRGRRVTVAEGARIEADGAKAGGRVDVIGTESGRFAGFVTVAGGAQGGFVDTSAPDMLVSGFVDASAGFGGTAGLWLIDPVDFVIGPSGTAGVTLTAESIVTALESGSSVVVDTGGPGSGGTATGGGSPLPGGPFPDTGAAGDITVLGGLTGIDLDLGETPTLTFTANGAIAFDSASGGIVQTGSGTLGIVFDAGTTIAMGSGSGFVPIDVAGTVAMTAATSIETGQITTTAPLGGGSSRPISLTAPTIAIDSDSEGFNTTGLGFGGLALSGNTASVRAADVETFAAAALSGVTTAALTAVGAGAGPLRIGNAGTVTIGPDTFDVLNLESPSLAGVTTLAVTAESRSVEAVQSVVRADLDLGVTTVDPALGFGIVEGSGLTLSALSVDVTGLIEIPQSTTLAIAGAARFATDGAITVAAGVAPGALVVGDRLVLEADSLSIAPLKFGGGFARLDVTRTGAVDFEVGPSGFDVVRLKNTGTAPLTTARLAATGGAPTQRIAVDGVDTTAPAAGVAIGTVLFEGQTVRFDTTPSAFDNLSVVTLAPGAASLQGDVAVAVDGTLALRSAGDATLATTGTRLNIVSGTVGGDLVLDSTTALLLDTLLLGGTADVTTASGLQIDTLTLGSGPDGASLPDATANALTAQAVSVAAENLLAGNTRFTLSSTANTAFLTGFDVADLAIDVTGGGFTIDRVALDAGTVRGDFTTTPAARELALQSVGLGAAAVTLSAGDVVQLDRVATAGDLAVSADAVRLGRVAVPGALTGASAAAAGGIVKLADSVLDIPAPGTTIVAVNPGAVPMLTLDAPGTAPGTGTRTGFVETFGALLDVGGATDLTANAAGDILLPSAVVGGNFLDNRFGGAVSARGGDVALEAGGALTLGRVEAAGDLAVRSNAANGAGGTAGIGQTAGSAPSAGLAVTGNAAFMTGRHGGTVDDAILADVVLDNDANAFGGTVGLLARDATVAATGVLAVTGARVSGDGDLSGTGGVSVTDSVFGGGLAADGGAGPVDLTRVAVRGALPGTEGIDAVAAGTISLTDIDGGAAGPVVAVAGGAVTATRVLHNGLALTGGPVTIADAGGGGALTVVAAGHADLADVTAAAIDVRATGSILADGVVATSAAGTLRLDAGASIDLGTVFAAGTMDMLADGAVATLADGLADTGFTVAGVNDATLGFGTDPGTGDSGPAATRVQEAGLAGTVPVAGPSRTFDGLVVAEGAARFEARGSGVTLDREAPASGGLHNRFADTLALYAPRTGTATAVSVEAGKASGQSVGTTPITLGRFPGETRAEAVAVAEGTLSLRNDFAIVDADGAIVVEGDAAFTTQDRDDAARFHDVVLDIRSAHRFAGQVSVDAEDIYLDATGSLTFGNVTARDTTNDATASALELSGEGLDRVLTVRVDDGVAQAAGSTIRVLDVDASSVVTDQDAPLAEITAARTTGGATVFADIVVANPGNDFQRLSVVGNAVDVNDANALVLIDSAAADNASADRGTLAVSAADSLILDTVRVGGDAPVAANTLTATASRIIGADIDAGGTDLTLTDAAAVPALTRFRTQALSVSGPGALVGLDLTDGQVAGVFRPGDPATLTPIGTVRVTGVTFGDGTTMTGSSHNPVLAATDLLRLDGVRAGGLLTASATAPAGTVRLGRVAVGSLDVAAGSGGILKIADADLPVLSAAAIARTEAVEPASPASGRSPVVPDLPVPLAPTTALLDVAGTATLTATGGGDILLPSVLGGPSGILHNRFGGAVSASGADIALEAGGAVTLGRVVAAGDLAVRSNAANQTGATGGVSQTAGPLALAVTGAAAFMTGRHGSAIDADALADIVLDNMANSFGGAVGVLGRDVTVGLGQTLTMADSFAGGTMRLTAPTVSLTDSLAEGALQLGWSDTATLTRVRAEGSGTAVDANGGSGFVAVDLAAPDGTLRVRADTVTVGQFVAGRLDVDATGALSLADGTIGQGAATGGTVGRLSHLRAGTTAQSGIDPALATGDLSVVASSGTLSATGLAADGALTLEASAGDVVLDRVRAGTLRATASGSVRSAARLPAAAETLQAFTVDGPGGGVIGLAVADGTGLPETAAGGRVRDAGPQVAGPTFGALVFDRLVASTGRATFEAGVDVIVVRETVPTINATIDPNQLHNAFGSVEIVTGTGRTAAVEVAGRLDLAGVSAGTLAVRSDSEGVGPFGGITQSAPLAIDDVASFIVGHAGGLPNGVPSGFPVDSIPFTPVGSIALTDPANTFGGVTAVAETVDIRSSAGFPFFESRVGGTLSIDAGSSPGAPVVVRDSLVQGDARIAAASAVELDGVGIGGDLAVASSAGDLTLRSVNALGGATLTAAANSIDAAALDVGADLAIVARDLRVSGLAVAGGTTFDVSQDADFSDVRGESLTGSAREVIVVDADVDGFDLSATDGPVLIRRLDDSGSASSVSATQSITVVDVDAAGALRLSSTAGDILGDPGGVRLRVGGDFTATAAGGDVRLAAAPVQAGDPVGSVTVGGDAVVTAAGDATLVGGNVTGALTARAGGAVTVTGVDVGGQTTLESGTASGSEPSLQVVNLQTGALATDSRGGQRIELVEVAGTARLVERGGEIVVGGVSVGGDLAMVNTAAGGGVTSRALEIARQFDLVGPGAPGGGGFSTVEAGGLGQVFGTPVGALLTEPGAPTTVPDQKRVTETVPTANPKIVPPFAGGSGGGSTVDAVDVSRIEVGGVTTLDVAGDVALVDLRPLGDQGANGNRFRGGLQIARAGGNVVVDGAGDVDNPAASSRDLTVRFGGDAGRAAGEVTAGQDVTFVLRDGAGLVFPESVGVSPENRLGALTVVGADGVTFAPTSGAAPDDVLFARDLVLIRVQGAVTTAGARDPARQLEVNNNFGGVNLLGRFDYSQSPGLTSIDLTGALGPDGLRTRPAGLRPDGDRGPDFLFNLCIIGDVSDCSASLTALTVPQVRFTVPDLFDIDLGTLADVYASFGNEELWALTPVFLEDLEEAAE